MGTANYEIRIKGRVGEALQLAFAGLTVTTKPVETVVCGSLPDQAALHGLLDTIQTLGLDLLEIRRLPEAGDAKPGGSHAAPTA